MSECDVSESGVSECDVSESGVSECDVSESGVSECDHEVSILRRPRPTRVCCILKKK